MPTLPKNLQITTTQRCWQQATLYSANNSGFKKDTPLLRIGYYGLPENRVSVSINSDSVIFKVNGLPPVDRGADQGARWNMNDESIGVEGVFNKTDVSTIALLMRGICRAGQPFDINKYYFTRGNPLEIKYWRAYLVAALSNDLISDLAFCEDKEFESSAGSP